MRPSARLATAALLLAWVHDVPAEEPPPEEPQRCWGMQARCNARGHLRVARRLDRVPDAIAKRFTGRPLRVFEIDVDSDGRPDHVVEEGPPSPESFRWCFVDSAGRVRHCANGGGDGFVYRWFAQLDGDRMLELFSMQGDEDYSDYRIQKLDPETWAPRDLVRIDPVLLGDHGKSFWGYPWDVSDLVLERRGGKILLRAAPPGLLRRNLEEAEDEGPARVVVLFTGTPTQEGPPEGFAAAVKASRLVSLDELVRLAKGPRLPAPAPRVRERR